MGSTQIDTSPPAPTTTPSAPASTVADQVAESDEESSPTQLVRKAERAETKVKAGAS